MPRRRPSPRHLHEDDTFDWKDGPSWSFVSRDGLVTAVARVETGTHDTRLTVDAGVFARPEAALAMGTILMRVLTGPSGRARTFTPADLALLSDLFNLWEVLPHAELRAMLAMVTEEVLEASAFDVTDVLNDQDR